jgi:hypothetical protein
VAGVTGTDGASNLKSSELAGSLRRATDWLANTYF